MCNTYKYCHITPVLIDLHWLPVTSRTVLKMLLLVFKTLHGNCPDYLSQLITVRTESRYSLRSSNQSNGILLQYPSIRSRTCLGDQAFLHAAPYLWNQLPVHVRNATNLNHFKALLKTHLFRIAFDLWHVRKKIFTTTCELLITHEKLRCKNQNRILDTHPRLAHKNKYMKWPQILLVITKLCCEFFMSRVDCILL